MLKRNLCCFILSFCLSLCCFAPIIGVEQYSAVETKTFTIDNITTYFSWATADSGASWIPVTGHMSSTISVPTSYTIFRIYIPLDRILPAGCVINSVNLSYRNGPGTLSSGSQCLWFGSLNGQDVGSNEDSSDVSFAPFSSGRATFSNIPLKQTADFLFLQYYYSDRSSSSFFFSVESISITYSYSGASGDLSDTNEKLDTQLQLTDNIWDNVKIIAKYIIDLPLEIGTALSEYFSNLGNDFSTFISDLGTRFENAINGMSVLFDGLGNNIGAFLDELGTNIVNGFNSALKEVFPKDDGHSGSGHPIGGENDMKLPDLNTYFDDSGVFVFFKTILENEVFMNVLRISLTLGVIGFVLFG